MESVYAAHNPSSGGGDFLKLKDGDAVKLRVASEPAISVYKAGDRPRYSWVIYNRDEKKVQVYSAGVSVFSQLRDLTEEWGDPQTFDIKIKRTGSGMNDTSYSVTPIKTSDELTKEQQEEVDKIELNKMIKGKWLSEYVEDNELPAPVTTEPNDGDGIALSDVPPDFLT